MTHDDAKNLVKKLNALFNGQINAEQAKAAIKRLTGFERKDVTRAVDEHRTRFEFVNWPELYKACEPIIEPSAPTRRSAGPDMTFVEVVKQQRPDLVNASDQEVIVRFWRGDWWRYKSDADRRLTAITDSMKNGDAHTRCLERGMTEEEIAVAHERVLESHDRNEEGYRIKVRTQCTGCLINAGVAPEMIEGWVDTVFSEPDHFRLCLAELRGELPAFSGAP
jgi:hypothetical protein